MVPYSFIRTIVAPQLQIHYIKDSVFSYGIAEVSEQWIESNGRIHVKNVTQKRGCGQDLVALQLIAKRTMIVTVMGIQRNIVSYFKDLINCKNEERYDPLWSSKHEKLAAETTFRTPHHS